MRRTRPPTRPECCHLGFVRSASLEAAVGPTGLGSSAPQFDGRLARRFAETKSVFALLSLLAIEHPIIGLDMLTTQGAPSIFVI